MNIILPNQYKQIPWKNGQGMTTEIFRYPNESTMENFLLRISMADVKSDSDFSLFSGYQRFISVLEGRYFLLSHNQAPFEKINQFELHHFSGNDLTTCKTDGQQLKDFNVIISDKIKDHVSVSFHQKNNKEKPNNTNFVFVLSDKVNIIGRSVEKYSLIILTNEEFLKSKLENVSYFLISIGVDLAELYIEK